VIDALLLKPHATAFYRRVIVRSSIPPSQAHFPLTLRDGKNKKPAEAAFCCGVERSERLDIRRLQAFGASFTSNSTFWPSFSVLKPFIWIAV